MCVGVCVCYLQELGELQVADVFGSVVAKVKADELTVPVEGDVVMHRRLAEYITHIFCRHTKKEKKKSVRGTQGDTDGKKYRETQKK